MYGVFINLMDNVMTNEDSNTDLLVKKAIKSLNSGLSLSIDDFSNEEIFIMFEVRLNIKNSPKTKDEMRLLLGCYNNNENAFNKVRELFE